MKWSEELQKYEPAEIEVLEQIPGEDVDDYWERLEVYQDKAYPHEYIPRNYKLFAYLANVRNEHDIIPLKTPTGFLSDVSREAEIVSEYTEEVTDNFGYTWYPTQSLINDDFINEICEGAGSSIAYRGFKELLYIAGRAYTQCENSRLLMWFCN